MIKVTYFPVVVMPINQPSLEPIKETVTQESLNPIPKLNNQPTNQPPIAVPKQGGHWLKKTIIIFASLIVILLFLVFGAIFSGLYLVVLNYFAKDVAQINDADLQLVKITIPREENAFYDLMEIGKYIYYPNEISGQLKDHRQGKTWDDQFVQEVLSKNEQALVIFDDAARKTRFQDPRVADPDKILSEATNLSFKLNPLVIVNISGLSSLKALYLQHQGNETEAFNEVFKVIEIGQKIHESQVSLFDYLIGIRMKQVGLELMQKIIATTKLPPETLIQNAQYLEKFKRNEEGLKIVFKGEYLSASQAIDAAISGNWGALSSPEFIPIAKYKSYQELLKSNFYFQPNKTKTIFANNIRSSISDIERPCALGLTKNLIEKQKIEMSSLLSSRPKLLMSENAVGKILNVAFFTSLGLDNQNEKRCLEDFQVSATQVMFALRAYNSEIGGYPTTLNELLPKYLSKIPEDPFDGKPIKYSPIKKIIYSVGKDGVDSGGSEANMSIALMMQMPDPTFRIEF